MTARAGDPSLPMLPRLRLVPWRFGSKGMAFGGALFAVIVLSALLLPLLLPIDPYTQHPEANLRLPVWNAKGDWSMPLGADKLGRDYLSRLIYGARPSLFIAFIAVAVSGVIGVLIGICGGYFGGRVDAAVRLLIAVRLALPVFLVAMVAAVLLGPSPTVLIVVMSGLLWDRFAVVTRSVAQQLRVQEYIVAARAVGSSHARILLREMLPNMVSAILVVATLEIAHVILLEAALSFLGFGVRPPAVSWGLMLAEGREYMFFYPFLVSIPGVAISVLILAVTLLGDGLRDRVSGLKL
jgi:peptide/nickel transport system permease protein